MNYSTRRLSASDTPILNDLIKLLGKVFENSSYTGSSQQYLSERLADDTCIVLVALDENNMLVGGLIAYELKKLEQERSEIYIYDLAVDALHRQRGVATSLIEHLKEVARACGAYVIFVQADEEDEAAVALYAKLASEHIVAHHFDITP